MKIYFIGICGIAMGSIAMCLKDNSHIVKGSDKGFYPPMSELLKENGMDIFVGYKEGRIKEFNPDLVVVGNSIPLDNVEYIESKNLNLKIVSFPEVLNMFAVKNSSIVVAGTFGKTTITAFLVYLFKNLNLPLSYMIGGKALNLDNLVEFNDSEFSVIEGDEYYTSKFDLKSKFFHYNPKYLILTSCEWDHSDIFKSEEEYVDNFVRLVKSIPEDGVIIANKTGKNVEEVIKRARREDICVYYNNSDREEIKKIKDLKPLVFGEHNYENILAAITLVKELRERDIIKNISNEELEEKILQTIKSFKGIERRLNILYKTDSCVIVDDFAHNPSKFKATITALKEEFKDKEFEIYAIIEPNLGNRTLLSLDNYENVFNEVKTVYLPKWRITKLKENSNLASQNQFAEMLKSSGVNTEIVLDDKILIDKLFKIYCEEGKKIIVFMGSEAFRNVPLELVNKING